MFRPLQTTALHDLLVSNQNVRNERGALVVDSDGDGLSDRAEHSQGSNAGARDSDNDGLSDGVERTSRWQDFNCLANYDQDHDGKADDSDGDGLTDCEEVVLGSSPNRFDSGGDGYSDGMKYRLGLNLSAPIDATQDGDMDGVGDRDEIRKHTDPRYSDTDTQRETAYRYALKDLGSPPGGQDGRCFSFEVHNIKLMATGRADGWAAGWNTVMLYMHERAMNSRPGTAGHNKVGCLKVHYDAESGNSLPTSGEVFFPRDAWKVPSEFDKDRDCVCPDGSTGRCTL